MNLLAQKFLLGRKESFAYLEVLIAPLAICAYRLLCLPSLNLSLNLLYIALAALTFCDYCSPLLYIAPALNFCAYCFLRLPMVYTVCFARLLCNFARSPRLFCILLAALPFKSMGYRSLHSLFVHMVSLTALT